MRNFLAGKALGTPAKNQPSSSLPSSSPAFATPAHPLRPYQSSGVAPSSPTAAATAKQTILPIVLAPAALRPLAFRTFTKKHSLTLTSSALQELAGFIGRHCGSGWREEGLAEKVLEEVARSWKNYNGGVIVDGMSKELKEILKTLEGNMSGGRIIQNKRCLLRQDSLTLDSSVPENDVQKTRQGITVPKILRVESGLSTMEVLEDIDDAQLNDVRKWLKVVSAFEQPHMTYNIDKKHFEKNAGKPSILPNPDSKTHAFRFRYNVTYQRLMRNRNFQQSAVAAVRAGHKTSTDYGGSSGQKLTPIANLLGRHGSAHMLLGLMVTLPAGGLGLCDLTGTIPLDISNAVCMPEDSTWFTPGMLVLVDGIYEEEDEISSSGLHGSRGVGGFIGGRFIAFFIGHPPCEKRAITLGISGPEGNDTDHTIGGGFGWTDFLGQGSERGVGLKMRRIEERLRRRLDPAVAKVRSRIVVLGEVNLNRPRAIEAVKKALGQYVTAGEAEASVDAYPLAFIFTGSFTDGPIMARGGSGGSVEYKEYFDGLAAAIGEFPALIQNCTFVFVPGDNDGWISSVTSGASTPVPRKSIPDMFTSRLRRMFAAAKNANSTRAPPEIIWTSNPSRLTLFGPLHEIVLFRDDISARLRRSAIAMKADRLALEAKNNTPKEATVYEDDGIPDDLDDLMEVESESQPTGGSTQIAKAPPPPPSSNDLDPGIKSSRKLVKTLLDQGHLAPFKVDVRPVYWDYAGALQLYPLPTAVILVDGSSNPFAVTYEGCHVLNPGTLLVPGRRGQARWAEYEVGRVGRFRECTF